MTLRKIRGVRPAQMRQMYMAAVVPPTDYEAPTWYAPSRNEAKRHVVAIERVQRLASTLILRTYKWVAMFVLQSEAKLQSVTDRLRERVFQHLTKLSLLATDRPLQGCISWFPLRGSTGSSLRGTVYEMYEGQLCTGFQYSDAEAVMAVMAKKFPSTRGSQACILDLVEKFLRLPLPACVAVR
jgi:hypothetical protein